MLPLDSDTRLLIDGMTVHPQPDTSHPAAWFEPVYAQANYNPDHIPWAKRHPHPYLLQSLSPSSLPPAPTCAIVVGCGLGDDAEALAQAGFTVTAFDISPTAISWCQQRFPQSPVTYTTADLLDLPPPWLGAFSFVWENRTIQALPLAIRTQAIAAVAALVAPGGKLHLATHWRPDDTVPTGPPWAVSDGELAEFTHHGLTEAQRQLVHDASKALTFAYLEFTRP